MAIYHCEMQNISRSDGRSIVACAAYRAGEKLYCDTYGKEQDYTKKTGIEYTQIFAPTGASPDMLDRQTLWNRVEQSELKKNGDIKQEARLAKEVEIALPHELDKTQRQALVTELCQSLVKAYGVAVDVAIHAPHVHGGSDERNHHAHILMTTRSLTPQGLGKKVRELDQNSTLKKIREKVADLTNVHLERAGLEVRVDHRSHKDRGLDIEPTFKEGLEATHAKRRGEELEIVKRNDEIKKRNKKAERLDMSIIETSNRVEQLTLEQQQQQQGLHTWYALVCQSCSSATKCTQLPAGSRRANSRPHGCSPISVMAGPEASRKFVDTTSDHSAYSSSRPRTHTQARVLSGTTWSWTALMNRVTSSRTTPAKSSSTKSRENPSRSVQNSTAPATSRAVSTGTALVNLAMVALLTCYY